MNKKGIGTEDIIFIILNLAFFAIMLSFIFLNTNGRAVYEQAYSKQIALMIDEAKPNMTIWIDMSDAIDIVKKTGQANLEDKNVVIDNDAKKVLVKFGDFGGKSFEFFNNADISGKFEGVFYVVKVRGR